MKRSARILACMAALAAATAVDHASAGDAGDAALQAIVDQRLLGDRTGACLAVAVVEKDSVARSYRCADPANAGRVDADTAFEIGSVSKTMTAVLLADLIVQGKASLDDPLSAWLPEGTAVPAFEGEPILLRHLVTHTSGLPALPSRLGAASMADPYAALTEEALLASLADVTLARPPGSQFEYSNFASMLLSYALARRTGSDFETLLRQRLFAPLGMDKAYVRAMPEGVRPAVGHLPNRLPTPAWTLATNLAGVGGVRATLDDMVRYVQGNLGLVETPLSGAIALAQRQVSEQPPVAMNWMLARAGERTVHVHEGGTGGFSAFVSVDLERQRGVVILSDTTWNSIGSLGSLGLHLVDSSFPLGKPRKVVAPPQELLEALAGDYQLQGAMKMQLRARDGRLFIHPAGQPEFEMGYDNAGDFFPLAFDAVLRPQKNSRGDYGFLWLQMGGAAPAVRIDADAPAAPALSDAQIAAYAGDYPLMPGFVLTVRGRDGRLYAQATGQGEFPLDATGTDTFEAAAYGIGIVFRRGADGEVSALDLQQGGQTLSGQRQ